MARMGEGLCEAAENGYFCSSLVYGNAYCTVSRHMRVGLILTQDPSIDSNTICRAFIASYVAGHVHSI